MSLDLVEVLIPIPLMENFSYLPPKNNSNLLKQGSRVLVPFGKRTLVGVVWSFSERDNLLLCLSIFVSHHNKGT